MSKDDETPFDKETIGGKIAATRLCRPKELSPRYVIKNESC